MYDMDAKELRTEAMSSAQQKYTHAPCSLPRRALEWMEWSAAREKLNSNSARMNESGFRT